MSEEKALYPWPPYYGHFNFFEARMRAHSWVKNVASQSDGRYELLLAGGRKIQIFICECYSFGVAELVEVSENIVPLEAIIINSAWCGYTWDAKRMARSNKVGLYKIGDFMAALNKPNLWEYLNEGELETFKKNGWT